MVDNCRKILCLLVIILAIALSVPQIAVASPSLVVLNPNSTVANISNDVDSYILEGLTPLERQELWALRQRRNKEIANVLNLPQRAILQANLNSGLNVMEALESVDLKIYQWEMIQAINELNDLKMKEILSRHSSRSVIQ
ncbi:MAG: hypothetical protein KME64_39780 [Scytonematopsis contorta HA4267-MV1]|jgi:hypothetical protein|nr:hypothetical protein [Scytonematopsis contorta HA4267-MV1]